MKLMRLRWTCLLLLLVGIAVTTTNVAAGNVGRWKDDGAGNCYFDANDEGPDQCTPPAPPTGRWKVATDGSCYFDANDSGPDQCVAPPAAEAASPGPDELASSSTKVSGR